MTIRQKSSKKKTKKVAGFTHAARQDIQTGRTDTNRQAKFTGREVYAMAGTVYEQAGCSGRYQPRKAA
jgi:hypothetical protein